MVILMVIWMGRDGFMTARAGAMCLFAALVPNACILFFSCFFFSRILWFLFRFLDREDGYHAPSEAVVTVARLFCLRFSGPASSVPQQRQTSSSSLSKVPLFVQGLFLCLFSLLPFSSGCLSATVVPGLPRAKGTLRLDAGWRRAVARCEAKGGNIS